MLLIECCRSALESGIVPFLKTDHATPSLIFECLEYIDKNYRHPISLDDICSIAHLSRGYLCRVFKKETGRSVFDYLINRRLQFATNELRSSQSKVIAIALEAGFGDLTYFNRIFKKRLGCSPSEYRKRSKEGSSRSE